MQMHLFLPAGKMSLISFDKMVFRNLNFLQAHIV